MKVIGYGSFGKVFLVQKKNNKKHFTMKCIRKEFILIMNQVDHTMTEQSLLENQKSQFIVEMEYAFQTEDKLYFVLEFVTGGKLYFFK